MFWGNGEDTQTYPTLFEQALELDMKVFVPPVLPLYQEVERLEASPNLTPRQREGLNLVELLLIGFTLYKTYQALSN